MEKLASIAAEVLNGLKMESENEHENKGKSNKLTKKEKKRR